MHGHYSGAEYQHFVNHILIRLLTKQSFQICWEEKVIEHKVSILVIVFFQKIDRTVFWQSKFNYLLLIYLLLSLLINFSIRWFCFCLFNYLFFHSFISFIDCYYYYWLIHLLIYLFFISSLVVTKSYYYGITFYHCNLVVI